MVIKHSVANGRSWNWSRLIPGMLNYNGELIWIRWRAVVDTIVPENCSANVIFGQLDNEAQNEPNLSDSEKLARVRIVHGCVLPAAVCFGIELLSAGSAA